MIAASATAFGFGHIIFHNWTAVALTLPGGLLFGKTYRRTSSLLAVSVEHALYGCAVFTIGYGKFLYEGTLSLFRH
jgi:membrane protease YdiL (CAAX protease family)